MKKATFLFGILLVLLAAGCSEKNLINNISGNWHVQKYLVDGADKTRMFDTTYLGFKWSFTSDKKFTKTWQTHDVGTFVTIDSIRHYDSVSQTVVLDSIVSSSAVVPYTNYHSLGGDWLLVNGNKYLQTRDSSANTQYEIVDEGPKALHLYSGREDYFLSQ